MHAISAVVIEEDNDEDDADEANEIVLVCDFVDYYVNDRGFDRKAAVEHLVGVLWNKYDAWKTRFDQLKKYAEDESLVELENGIVNCKDMAKWDSEKGRGLKSWYYGQFQSNIEDDDLRSIAFAGGGLSLDKEKFETMRAGLDNLAIDEGAQRGAQNVASYGGPAEQAAEINDACSFSDIDSFDVSDY